jgi:hypothetical protein
MNEHTEEPHDPDMAFERPEDNYEGQDYFAEQEPGTEDAELAPELPEKPKMNPMITNAVIFGGIGVFVLVMGWINFGSVLFPKSNQSASSSGSANTAALLSPVTTNAPSSAAQPVVAPPASPVVAGGTPTTPGTPMATDATAAAAIAPPNAPVVATATPTDVAALSVMPGAPVTPPPTAATATQPITAVPLSPTPTTPGAMATAVPNMPSAPVMTPPADNGKLAELQQQNQDLTAKSAEQDQTINDLRSQLADAQSKLADAQAQLTQAQTAAAATPAPAKPKKKVAKKAPVHHTVTADAKPPAPLTDNPPTAAPAVAATASTTGYLGDTLPSPPPYWVLRSAADNSAWVAHPGDSQLYQVTVGDQLPGVGKIISIQQQNGAWVVAGTQGQIRQP